MKKILSLILALTLLLGTAVPAFAAEATEEIPPVETQLPTDDSGELSGELSGDEDSGEPDAGMSGEAGTRAAEVASGTCGDNLSWILDASGTLTVTGTGEMYDYPDVLAAPWSDYLRQITALVLEEGITYIGEGAFAFCNKLLTVQFPSTLEVIGDSAFSNCPKLTGVQLPESVTKIGMFAFCSCSSLTSANIPSGVTYIYEYTFSGCSKLASITIPVGVTQIEQNAFYNCKALQSVTIPGRVTQIDRAAFMNCTGLTTVVFEGDVPVMFDTVSFPGECGSFYGVTANAYYPEGNTTWTDDKLQNYGGTLTWIAGRPGGDVPCSNGDHVPGTAAGEETGFCEYCGIPCRSTGDVIWAIESDGTMHIYGNGAIDPNNINWTEHRNLIYSLVVREGVTGTLVGFEDFDALQSVTLPGTLTEIGDQAFRICDNLSTINFPEGLEAIGDRAFHGCMNLGNIQLPASLKHFGAEPFSFCRYVDGIWVNEANSCFINDANGVLFSKDMTQLMEAPFLLSGKYTIPASVTSLAEGAFNSCCHLTGLEIPNGISVLPLNVFNSLTQLQSVTIPASVTQMDLYAFGYCTALKTVTFKGNAPEIHSLAFTNVTATAYYPAEDTTWTPDVMLNYGGTLTWKTAGSSTLPAPAKPYKIANVVSGVHVYWKAAEGAVKYGLWRSETGKDGTYKWLANPTVPHFTDTKVESGKTYYYKVTAMSEDGVHSEKSPAIGVVFVSTPDITSRFNKAAGITLGWNKIEGATGYAIYRKSYSGTDVWVRVATVSGNSTLTWQDTSVKNNNGTVYRYTVRALAGSNMNTLSGCRSTGRTMARLTSRTLSNAVKNGTNGIKCTWTTSAAVTGYEVRFMVGDTVYKTFTVGNYATGVKTFTGLPAGQTYKIQVRSYLKIDGMGFYSAWSTAKTVTL